MLAPVLNLNRSATALLAAHCSVAVTSALVQDASQWPSHLVQQCLIVSEGRPKCSTTYLERAETVSVTASCHAESMTNTNYDWGNRTDSENAYTGVLDQSNSQNTRLALLSENYPQATEIPHRNNTLVPPYLYRYLLT